MLFTDRLKQIFLLAFYSTFSAFPFLSTPAHASPFENSLNSNDEAPIIVTATRSTSALNTSPGAFTVLSEEDIKNSHSNSLIELLATTPGLNITQAGSIGSQSALFMRGSESNHTLILINGQHQKVSLGSASLQFIDLNLVERIEILRGNQSSLYGSDAIGGVINIITKKSAQHSSVSVGTGSNSSQEIVASSGTDKFNLGISRFKTEGINSLVADTQNDQDGFLRESVSFGFSDFIHEQVETRVNLSAKRGFTEYDSAPYFDFFSGQMIDSTLPYSEFRSSNFIVENIFYVNDSWQSSIAVGQASTETREKDLLLTDNGNFSKFTHQTLTLKAQSYLRDNIFVNFGIDVNKDEWEQQANFQQKLKNDAAFALLQYEIKKHHLSGSARYDDNEFYGHHYTYQLAWEWALQSTFRPYVTQSTGFKAPDFDELYSPFYVPNPDLAPEISTSQEAGIKSESAAGLITISAFKNRIEDFISYELLDPVLFTGQLANIEEVEIKGLEFSHSIAFNALRIESNASYIKAKNLDTDTELLRRPQRIANVNLFYRVNKISGNVGVHAEGNRADIDSETFLPTRVAGFATAHAQITYHSNKTSNIQLKINNLFDKEYQLIDGYNMDGTSVMLSIKTTF